MTVVVATVEYSKNRPIFQPLSRKEEQYIILKSEMIFREGSCEASNPCGKDEDGEFEMKQRKTKGKGRRQKKQFTRCFVSHLFLNW